MHADTDRCSYSGTCRPLYETAHKGAKNFDNADMTQSFRGLSIYREDTAVMYNAVAIASTSISRKLAIDAQDRNAMIHGTNSYTELRETA